LKAYYRRGSANYALGKLKEALKDFKHVAVLKPKDEDAVKKMKVCDKEMKAELFTKAIESDVTVSLMSQVDIAKIVVEPTYEGPRLNEAKADASSSSVGAYSGLLPSSHVPMTFVHEIIAHFKNQKVLHRK
jgi:serine/threonine-protein phosphatase 5